MQILIDANNRMLQAAESDPGWKMEPGYRVVEGELPPPPPDGGQPVDMVWDEAAEALVWAARALTPAEQDVPVKRALRAQLQVAYDGWPKLTAAQKDAAIRATLRAAIRALS
jgi:hypothetical protein